MSSIKIKSPTRIDLAGGTLDCWPLYALLGECHTINIAIDIYTQVELTPREDKKIEVWSQDTDFKKSYDSIKECLQDQDPLLNWFRIQIEYWNPRQGFSLVTFSESPIGAGLGGSSSLTISLILAFSKWLNRDLKQHEIVTLASNLEAQGLWTPTGTQDYYPPLLGGLNIITYSLSGTQIHNLPIPKNLFLDHSILVYTGKAHNSGINNWKVISSMVERNSQVHFSLKKIKEVSLAMRHLVLANKWNQLPSLLEREYQARSKLSDAFLSPEIEKVHLIASKEGAYAVKICGAGGGGSVLIWSPKDKKERIQNKCLEEGFKILKAQPVERLTVD